MRSLAGLLLLLALAAAPTAAGPNLRSKRVDAAVEAVQPAVVKVFGAKGFRGIYGYMTGVLVHESGLLVTRGSVTLEEAGMINVHLHDGRRRMAEIVREDRASRMLILRLLRDGEETFPAARLGKSADVRPGQFVLLIGNAYKVALGEERCAVNLGVVSAITSLNLRSGLADFPYEKDVILHDAMNNPGVYGGPLVNLAGEVVGISGTIVESRETNAQVHYAIPIDDLRPFITDTIKRPDAPVMYVPRGADGAPLQPPEEDKTPGYHGIRVLKGGINRATPAYVDRVLPGSPAAKGGLRPDDLVLKIDEARVKSWKSFDRIMSTYRAGQTVKFTVKRGSDVKLFVIVLEKESNQ